MNLRALRYLVALAECLNFSRAAERCAVTQSTLSIQLRKLEEYLGVTLFERDRTHVALTAEGREVLELARTIVRAADEIVAVARRARMRGTCGKSPCEAREAAAEPAEPLIDDINCRRMPGD